MTQKHWLLLSLVVLAGVVYANSLQNGFALDDVWIIEKNEQVHGIDAIPKAITGPYWPTGPRKSGLYRPLTTGTYAVEWDLWGGSPWGFHLVNILLHVVVTLLVFSLCRRLSGSSWSAWAGAAVFAVHPVHVEAVANVVGRAEILSALFFLAGCLGYMRLRSRWNTALLLCVAYFLSLASKEMGATLPAALLLIEWIRRGSIRGSLDILRRRWTTFVALAATLAGYFLLRLVNIGTLLGRERPPWYFEMPEGTPTWTAIRVWPEYLRLMVVPLDLVPDYGPGVIVPVSSPFSPLVLAGVLLAIVVAVIVWRTRRHHRLLGGGILWFALTVLPVAGLLFPVGVILAERTLYLPSVGLSLAVAGVATWIRTRRPSLLRPAVAVLLLALAAGGVRTWTQNPVWASSSSVITHLMRTHPANYRAQWGIGSHLASQGDTVRAIAHLRLAARMAPGHHALRLDFGKLLRARGRWQDAARQFEVARRVLPSELQAHVYLLDALLQAGRPGDAVSAASRALQYFPASEVVHHLASVALMRLGRFEEAAVHRIQALRRAPAEQRWWHWLDLARVRLRMGSKLGAAEALARARGAAPATADVPTLPALLAADSLGS